MLNRTNPFHVLSRNELTLHTLQVSSGKHLTQEANFQIAHLKWNADTQVTGPKNLDEIIINGPL